MNNISLSKCGGQCLIAGGVVSFIPFLMQILVGGPPPDNEYIFSYFANMTVDGGSLSVLYTMMSVFGVAFIMYGIFTLNGFLQEQKKDALLSLGTFLFLLGHVGGLVAWSVDPAMIIAQDTANISNMFISEMSLFFMFGPLFMLGSALVSLVLANREFVNPLFMRISAAVFVLIIPAFAFSAFTLTDPSTHNSVSSIMPVFAGFSIAQIVSLAWQIMVGLKMMKN